MESKGKIIFLLEDDVVLEENFIEEVLKTFDLNPRIGCIYSQCVWVHREGLSSKGGVKGFIAKLISKLSVHESLFPKQVKKISDYLYEVPVFTMCFGLKRESIYKAGLYEESVEEPILGEDFDLSFRIRNLGYKIVTNEKAVAYHYTRQVTRRLQKISRSPKFIEGIQMSEIYFLTKNLNQVGFYILPHMIYRILESFVWAFRSKKITTVVYGVKGVLKGFITGFKQHIYSIHEHNRNK